MPTNEKRKECVDKARESWIRKLIDLSRRNNLLYYRNLKLGTLELSFAKKETWANLLQGETVAARNLVEGLGAEEISSKVLEIYRRAQSNLEEKGLATLFVALGMATWKSADEGRDTDAPVLLLPVEVVRGSGTGFSIKRTGELQVNQVLLYVLKDGFGTTVDADGLIGAVLGDQEDEPFDLSPAYRLLESWCAGIAGFHTRDVAILGNFAFQKMAMVNDLRSDPESMAGNDLIAALAGDSEAKERVGLSNVQLEPREFDRHAPQTEFLVLDADSSQQTAIAKVLAGESTVVHGPPGTGKSQTIANLIASLAAAGKRVLFVAEKRAALQVVLKRLKDVGLARIAIDLHGADVSPKNVMEQIGAALDGVRQATPVNCEEMHKKFEERRERLNRHVAAMHSKRVPSGMSVYELQGAILRLPKGYQSETRWRGGELNTVQTAGPGKIRDFLQELGGFETLFTKEDESPWTGVTLEDGMAAQRAIDVIAKMAGTDWPEFLETLQETCEELKFRSPENLKEIQSFSALLSGVRQTLEKYAPQLFQEDVRGLLRQLEPGKNGGFSAVWAWSTNGPYRQARKTALSYRAAGKAASRDLSAELSLAEEQKKKWTEWSRGASLPQSAATYPNFRQKLDVVNQEIGELSAVIGMQWETKALKEFTAFVETLAKDRVTPMRLPKLFQLEKEMEKSGLTKLAKEMRNKKIAGRDWISLFDAAWFSSCLEAVQAENPEIAGFNGRTHDALVREFRELDEERIRIAAARVRRAYGERAIAVMNAQKSQELLIRSEAQRKRRHRPLRAVFADAADVLTAICPCWMASPLSVSQLLNTKATFDVVIFDEASQVLPEDAVPAIMRGAKLVVAGDAQQLPPTTFFAAADGAGMSGEEENQATDGYESLLDVTNAFLPSAYLDWHYRSKDESLISFSNQHVYEKRLVTFPGPNDRGAIQHALVQQRTGIDGEEDSSGAEVTRVVELILEHAEKRSNESLGVIAMGIKHADRVQKALDEALASRMELAEFFDAEAAERFFVKNLERVQGDERDAIILTVGYGKDKSGNLPFRFGPLLARGGGRRLNVAVTRARRRMTLVSSFTHLAMDPAKIRKGTGVEMLRDYLEYAASGGKRAEDGAARETAMNGFELEVKEVLEARGIPLVPQVGASRYRIDFATMHPEKKGLQVLAIECDGASYHASPTARDRDRLRQKQLESLGWGFHRIWSTDWFMNKAKEVERAIAAYEKAVRSADATGKQFAGNLPAMQREVNGTQVRGRVERPRIPKRESITDYSKAELLEWIAWIDSDGGLRTHEEKIEELLPELGFARRGARIEGVLKELLAGKRN